MQEAESGNRGVDLFGLSSTASSLTPAVQTPSTRTGVPTLNAKAVRSHRAAVRQTWGTA
jgi:hypothetical protein